MMTDLDNKPFAEVIASSLHSFTAQSWQWDRCAPFGSLVSVERDRRTLYALVHHIQTGSLEPTRQPFAYQKTEQELLAEQPHIFSFLKTTFSCVIVGYQDKEKLHYASAPEPPKIHAFVAVTPADKAKSFFWREHYLQVLFGYTTQILNLDELLVAIMQRQRELGLLSPEHIASFAQTYTLLTGNDYRRLKLFLQRVQAL